MNKAVLIDSDKLKIFKSENYNYSFDKKTGFFARWGKTQDDDPDFAPSPEILDLEITTICSGPNGTPCPFCYKSNTLNGTYMNFETYKKLFEKLPKTITQIAYGADATLTSNPDWYNIFKYTKEHGIIPNVTVANISDETADKIASVCGATAISRYSNKNWCYDSVKKLTDRGMTQVNIHQLVATETYDQIIETINDIKVDERLSKLNAIVFLSLKQKGRGEHFHTLDYDKFKYIIKLCRELEINFGFDSCSAPKVFEALKDEPDFKQIEQCIEPCESSCFSSYINTEGDFYPCSFSEGTGDWKQGLSVLKSDNFVKDIWQHDKTKAFREKLCKNKDSNACRNCPLFKV